jgi:hypothetical protein
MEQFPRLCNSTGYDQVRIAAILLIEPLECAAAFSG